MTAVAKAYLSLGALLIGGVHEDAPVGDGAVNIRDHGAHVSSPERGAAVLQEANTTICLSPTTGTELCLVWLEACQQIIQQCANRFLNLNVVICWEDHMGFWLRSLKMGQSLLLVFTSQITFMGILSSFSRKNIQKKLKKICI